MKQSEFFDNLAAKWDDMERPDIADRIAAVVAAADLVQGQSVLDVGTGTGVLLPLIAGGVGPTSRIVAMDVSAGMLAVAQGKALRGPVTYLHADIEDCGLADASFDRVFCNAVFPHFTDSVHALAEIKRMMRPNGMLIISHPIGREAVNAIHRGSGETVAGDRVPGPDAMREILEQVGFVEVSVVDEPEFYLACGRT